jgi:hypothetical protein
VSSTTSALACWAALFELHPNRSANGKANISIMVVFIAQLQIIKTLEGIDYEQAAESCRKTSSSY